MRGIALAISSVGVVVGALAVSAGIRRPSPSVKLGRARISPLPPVPQLRAMNSDAPAPARSIAPAESIPAHVIAPSDVVKASVVKPAIDMPQRSPKQAAGDLYAYVTQMVRDGRGADLGSTANPNANVLTAQMAMKGIKADGIYGNATRARGKELLGREFPQREPKRRAAPPPPIVDVEHEASPDAAPAPAKPPPPPPPPPPPDQHVAEHSPIEAANALHLYINSPHADLGSKERPNDLIRGAQHDMGQLAADGIFGPKTRARMNALLKGKKHA